MTRVPIATAILLDNMSYKIFFVSIEVTLFFVILDFYFMHLLGLIT